MPSNAFLEEVRRLRNGIQRFILLPEQWNALRLPIDLRWESIKFNDSNKIKIPDVRGIYAFVVKQDHTSLPIHGYITYVGLTGDTRERTLKMRYQEYLGYQKRPKRPLVHVMLNRWKDNLYFNYVEIPNKLQRLNVIETALLDALIPPYNEDDFSGEFGRIVRTAWRQ